MKNVYVSCPMSVSQEDLTKVCKLILSYGVTPTHWNKDSVYDEKFTEKIIAKSDAFVVILTGFGWYSEILKMTSGSRKELLTAIKYSKPIFIVYQKFAVKELGIYAADTSNVTTSISGISGTGHTFQDMAKDNKEEYIQTVDRIQRQDTVEHIVFKGIVESLLSKDQRILLFF